MKLEVLSTSSYKTYGFCQWKWFLIYVLGFEDPSGPAASLGHVAHSTLEKYGKSKLDNQPKSLDEFDVVWEQGITLLKDAEKIEYQKCPSSKIKALKALTKDFLLTQHSPLKSPVMAVEQRFKIVTTEPQWSFNGYNIRLTGVIDRVDKIDDSTIEIVDYKTGQRRDFTPRGDSKKKETEDLYNDVQLRMYHWAARKLWPQYTNVLVTLIFLNDGGPYTVPFSDSDIPYTEKLLKRRSSAIAANNDPSQTKGWHCSKLCHFGKSEICDSVWKEKNDFGHDFVVNKYQVLNSKDSKDTKNAKEQTL